MENLENEKVNVFARRSWRNDERVMENHGKIMEYDSGKALGTLYYNCNIFSANPEATTLDERSPSLDNTKTKGPTKCVRCTNHNRFDVPYKGHKSNCP